MKKAFLLIIFCAITTGCVPTRADGYRAFGNDMASLKGKSFQEAYIPNVGDLRDKKPVQIKKLANGNEIRIYQSDPRQRDKVCTSYVEVNPKTGIIVDTQFSGSQCLRAV